MAELPEYLPDRALICLVEGPGDSLGVVSICPGLLASVIEMQAMGRVSTRQAVPRRPTGTDAAICADFVNACLAELGTDLAGMPGYAAMRGFRYAGFLADPRPLDLMLEDRPYRRLELRLRAGDAGQRDGTLTVVLPLGTVSLAAPPERACGSADAGAKAAAESVSCAAAAPAPQRAGIASALRDSPVLLHGVLCRRQIGLGQLKALLAGQQISLPRSALDNATLETASGQVIARGKLGESEGRHALRLTAATGELRVPDQMLQASARMEHVDEPMETGARAAMPLGDTELPDPFRSDPDRIGGPDAKAPGRAIHANGNEAEDSEAPVLPMQTVVD